MTVLVTGANGFVGAAVARKLVERGDSVRAMVRASSDCRNLERLEVERVEADLRDRASLDRAVRGCRRVFHVAADYRLWVPDADTIYQTNVDGTRNVIEAAVGAGVERIVYTSSVAVLGLNEDGSPADEDTPVTIDDMIGHYKKSKFLAEKEVRRLTAERHAPVVIVNPSTPVGPGDIKPTPTGRVILNAAMGRIPAYVDTGLNIVHVDDVAEGQLLAAERGAVGERYILGGENMTLRDILSEIARLSGRSAPSLRLPGGFVMPAAMIAEAWARLTGSGEPIVTVDGVRMARKKMFFSSDKAKRELGYAPRPAVEALADAIGWFRAAGYIHR